MIMMMMVMMLMMMMMMMMIDDDDDDVERFVLRDARVDACAQEAGESSCRRSQERCQSQRHRGFQGESHGNCAFRRPVDAIAYFKDYALSVTSQRQLDHVFPAAFAGALHNVAKLTARMPAMKDFV